MMMCKEAVYTGIEQMSNMQVSAIISMLLEAAIVSYFHIMNTFFIVWMADEGEFGR